MTSPTKDEMASALGASESRVDARLANFDTSMKTGFAELRTEFAELRADMAKQMGEMRTEIERMRVEMQKGMMDIVKWVIGFGLASIGAIFAVSKMTEKPPPQAAVQPTPIVIYAQPAAPSGELPAAPPALGK